MRLTTGPEIDRLPCATVSTEKRQRQKAGRQARLEAEQKRKKRKQSTRRIITVVVVAAVVVGISYLIFKPGKKSATAASTTTTTAPAAPAKPKGGSGNTSPSAITTSADCPANFKATLNKPYWTSAPKLTIDPTKTYTATVTTDVGSFTIALDAKQYPTAVNNFVFLANQHFFDCITFHRVIQTFVDQTGDPTGTGTGGPGYQFTAPAPKRATPQYPLGSVVMANADNPPSSNPKTNGSQFFIVAGSEGESLTPNYALFGQVTSGMSVVDTINSGGSAASDQTGTPVTLHRMVSVTVTQS